MTTSTLRGRHGAADLVAQARDRAGELLGNRPEHVRDSVTGPPQELQPRSGAGGAYDPLAEYCRELFAPLPRSDQRAWAEVYVRGLLTVPGRKTPARISEHVIGRRTVAQLQQFVNQSPWNDHRVRGLLAEVGAAAFQPRAWALDTIAFPKNGTCSVGVARQYSAADGRVFNCQVGMAASLVGDGVAVPVDWRLVLPEEWDEDAGRRACAHVPSAVRHLPHWQYAVQLVDELLEDWGMTPRPVLVDWRRFADEGLAQFVHELEQRGLRYVIRVDSSTGILPAPNRPGQGSGSRMSTAFDLGRSAQGRAKRATVAWREGESARLRQSQFLTSVVATTAYGVRPLRYPRLLVMQWPIGRDRPQAYWLTNVDTRQAADVVGLAKLGDSSRTALNRMLRTAGLQDFEGRSFRGWHHHVTLASVAFSYQIAAAAQRREDESWFAELGV